MTVVKLEFRSELSVPATVAWEWITSMAGIVEEMRPLFRMTAPPGVHKLTDVDFEPGRPLFRSRLYLFGFVPFGYSDLTLLELTQGVGFVEQSPMTGMRLWRHERTIIPANVRCTITDRLTFEPRFATRVVAWFTARMFAHRHAVLRRRKQ